MSISTAQNYNIPDLPLPPTFREILRDDAPDDPYDILTMVYGWFPVIGHVLGLYNLAVGRKKRGQFFLLYATLTPIVMLPLLIYSKRFERFFESKQL